MPDLKIHPACRHCGGDAGPLIEGAHALCSARHERGLPTPSLGMRCYDCDGAGSHLPAGVALSYVLDTTAPAFLAATMQRFACPTCKGSGVLPEPAVCGC